MYLEIYSSGLSDNSLSPSVHPALYHDKKIVIRPYLLQKDQVSELIGKSRSPCTSCVSRAGCTTIRTHCWCTNEYFWNYFRVEASVLRIALKSSPAGPAANTKNGVENIQTKRA